MEQLTSETPAKTKIAVLGGGVSAMTAVVEMTEDPNWQEKYEITVYQMGWRLGGKGASGRNRDIANRIEEHGLHLWFGFYDNAFDLMQRCYRSNNRPLTKPLATWQEAFKPYDYVVLEENLKGTWRHWPFFFAPNDEIPGKQAAQPTVWEYVGHALALLHSHYSGYIKKQKVDTSGRPVRHSLFGALFNGIAHLFGGKSAGQSADHYAFFEGLEDWWDNVKHEAEAVALDLGGRLIYAAMRMVQATADNHHEGHHNALLAFIEKILKWLWAKFEHKIEEDDDARHLWIAMDFALSNIRGMIRDGVITRGFDVINDKDYRDWIKSHGASQITLDSASVQGIYGLVFGGFKFFTFEAGTALRGAMRMAFTYRGSVYYRMQAGMGDTIFAPIYEVLKKRGVKFEFFHKVKNLRLDETKKNIAAIEIGVQATLRNGAAEYEPLFDVKGLPCWPSKPFFEQLEQGQALQNRKIDLESYWTPWENVAEKTLVRGRDFDIVIQGISIGALPVIAKELLDVSQAWRDMTTHITACETQAFQLWFYPDLAGLGWPYWMKELPLSGTYKEPFDTWADMSDLIIRESWPDAHSPNNIAYLCGPIMRKGPFQWDFNDHSVPQKAYEAVKNGTLEYLRTLSPHLWPNASDRKGNFDFDLLVDTENNQGQARFDRQWFRANIDPSELYVLSETNSSKFRLKTDQSGFENLYITGDWIDNGLNAGCVEASVIAGKQTARAVLKQDHEIFGETDKV